MSVYGTGILQLTPLDRSKKLYKYDGRGLDFSGQDLRGIRIEDTSFVRANLEGTNFEGAVFDGVCLNYANLEGANLKGVNFITVNAKNADFRNADLSDSTALPQVLPNYRHFRPPDFEFADFRGANLRNVKFHKPFFRGATLSEADLTGATFIEADCANARLIKSNLTGAHLDSCDFLGTNLTRATLDRASFRQCQMPGAILDGVHAIAAKFIDISLYVSLVPDSASNVNVNKALNISARGADFRDSIVGYTNLKNFYNFIYTPKNGAVPEDPLSEFLYELGVPVAFCIHGILPPYIEYINKHIEDLEARIINLCGTKKLKSPAATIRRALDNSPDMADLILSDLDMTVSMCLNNVDIRLAY